MNDLAELSKIIKERRLSLNLRMEDVAKSSGITRATLYSIEKGDCKCSISTLFKVLDVLNLSFRVDGYSSKNTSRDRATRSMTLFDKKVNRFIVMCVEQYSLYSNQSSDVVYERMLENGVIDDLINDYEDLHGMSTIYLNDYISSLIGGNA